MQVNRQGLGTPRVGRKASPVSRTVPGVSLLSVIFDASNRFGRAPFERRQSLLERRDSRAAGMVNQEIRRLRHKPTHPTRTLLHSICLRWLPIHSLSLHNHSMAQGLRLTAGISHEPQLLLIDMTHVVNITSPYPGSLGILA